MIASKNWESVTALGAAEPPVMFASNVSVAICASEIVPVAVIGPPLSPVPVST
jgi:hypothetical protein